MQATWRSLTSQAESTARSGTGSTPRRSPTSSIQPGTIPHRTPTPHHKASQASHSHGVIHGDQSFRWHRPFEYGREVSVRGEVSKLRERGGVAFLGFSLSVGDEEGTFCDGESTFVLSGSESAASGHEERDEPAPLQTSDQTIAGATINRSVSRSGLVEYAGASRDFNPLHWDHETAVAAGLPGVVVHGLLQSAWILQATGPVRAARFRFRSPLLPGVGVGVILDDESARPQARVTDGQTDYVTATFERR